MKTSFLRILVIICAVVWSLGVQAQRSIDLINDNDRVQLDEAIGLMDSGKPKDAIKIKNRVTNFFYGEE